MSRCPVTADMALAESSWQCDCGLRYAAAYWWLPGSSTRPAGCRRRTFSGTGALKNMEPEASLSGVYRLF